MSILWSLPPLFSKQSAYVFDGIGHCSLNWRSQALNHRLFLISTIIFIYFIPLALLLYLNISVIISIRTFLLKNQRYRVSYSDDYLKIEVGLRVPFILALPLRGNARYAYLRDSQCVQMFQRRLSDVVTTQQASRVRQLRIDYRYARATAIVVTLYILAWTPYTIIAGYQMNGKTIPTILNAISDCVAELALILSPAIYLWSIRMG